MLFLILFFLRFTSANLNKVEYPRVFENSNDLSSKYSQIDARYETADTFILIGTELMDVSSSASEFEIALFAMALHKKSQRNKQSLGHGFEESKTVISTDDGEISWIEYNVMKQETLWNEWSCVTCVQEHNTTYPISVLIVLTWKAKATEKNNFNFAVANLAALKMGYITSQEFEKKIKVLYPLENGLGQLFVRQFMVSQRQKFRKCKWNSHIGGHFCDQWSTVESVILPVVGGHDLRWITGKHKVAWNKCIDTVSV